MYTIQNTLYVMTPHACVHLESATSRIDETLANAVGVAAIQARNRKRRPWLYRAPP
jgi:hypothetical protein